MFFNKKQTSARQPRPGADPRHELGRKGEQWAAKWLHDCYGMRLLASNWRHGHGELDLILSDGTGVVFVEVKVVKENALVPGFFRVGAKQRKSLRRTALAWLEQRRPRPRTWRLDIVVISHNGEDLVDLQHYPNIRLFGRYGGPHYR